MALKPLGDLETGVVGEALLLDRDGRDEGIGDGVDCALVEGLVWA